MKSLTAWLRQPTTLTAIALLTGSATYAATRSPELAAAAAAALLGTVDDHTASLLDHIDALEDLALGVLHPESAASTPSPRSSVPDVQPVQATAKESTR